MTHPLPNGAVPAANSACATGADTADLAGRCENLMAARRVYQMSSTHGVSKLGVGQFCRCCQCILILVLSRNGLQTLPGVPVNNHLKRL